MNAVPTDPYRVPHGEYLGTLDWLAADGTKRRWIIRQGKRANGIAVSAKGRNIECGWDRFLRFLRKKLSMPKTIG